MSFILDALRRAGAERERERGHLPDLHAHALSVGPTHASHAGAAPWAKAGAGAVALLLAALAGWQWHRAEAPALPQAVPVAEAESRVAPPPAMVTPPPPRHPEPAAEPPAPAPAVLPPSPVTPAAAVVPAQERRAEAAVAAPVETATPRTNPAKASEPAKAPAPTPAPASPRLTMTLDAASGALPPMKVGGVMYSDTPEGRVLVINDQVLREGETVQPGLVLEHIGPKSAKLRWKDQLLEVPY